MKPLSLWWTLLAAAILGHQVYLWTGGLKVETQLLSLLPRGETDAAAEEALHQLGESTSRSVVVLVTATSAEASQEAAQRFVAALPAERLTRVTETSQAQSVVELLVPYASGLLTASQRKRLSEASDEDLVQQAWSALTQPVGQRFRPAQEDPLQLFSEFLRERAQSTPVRPVNGWLMVGDSVLLRLEVKGSAFALDGVPHLARALEEGRRAVPGVDVVAAGVPLFAEAAATQANTEVNTVGWGSLAAILVLMGFAFRSLRPLLLVVTSVLMGVAAGLSACVVVFGEVHLMTLVFGAGLVGVAEDYGIHYFCSRQAHPKQDKQILLRHLIPGLSLAMLTSVAGYAMLGIAPFPGLRQVALFSSVGLGAAFLTVVAWFPILDGGEVRMTKFAAAWAASRARWPSLSLPGVVVATVVLGAVGAFGISQLKTDDDIRSLQASPKALMDAQRLVAERIGLPSPAQFFVVRGRDEAERLAREEALTSQLDALRAQGVLQGYEAISAWVPSPEQQIQNERLAARVRKVVLKALADELEVVDDDAAASPSRVLSIDEVMQSALGAPLKQLKMSDAHVVLLHAPARQRLEELASLSTLPGVKFVDRTADWSSLMRRWRVGMSQLLVVGYALILAILWWRFGARAWRALVPTALASALALSAVAFLGEPLTLFHVLALWLLLGMGVDYGIFLLEHQNDDGEAWLAVGLGAASTLLSFGLLAVSTTSAIHAFGVTLGVGVTLVWMLSPTFARN